MHFTSKIWKVGTGTLAITITKGMKEYLNLKEGDLVELNLINVYKQNDNNKKTIGIPPATEGSASENNVDKSTNFEDSRLQRSERKFKIN